MISSNISNTDTIRNLIIIDDKGAIRLIVYYPVEIGRNVSEILRSLNAIQLSQQNKQKTPANWKINDTMILNSPEDFNELLKMEEIIQDEENGMSWYLSFKKPENLKLESTQNKEKQAKEIINNRNIKRNTNTNKVIRWKKF